VTSERSLDIRIVRFLSPGVAAEYDALPVDVRDEADFATTLLQNSRLPGNAKRLHGVLKGVTEIKVDCDTNTYRVYYAAELECCLYIIDAGMKKSARGGAIPITQVDRLMMRLAQATAHYKANEAELREAFEARRMARQLHQDEGMSHDGAKQEDLYPGRRS